MINEMQVMLCFTTIKMFYQLEKLITETQVMVLCRKYGEENYKEAVKRFTESIKK